MDCSGDRAVQIQFEPVGELTGFQAIDSNRKIISQQYRTVMPDPHG
jgi:hypothetical protein